MSDRELLELAAKAAGYKLERFISAVYPYPTVYTVNGKPWNPLTDDGDALRLSVKLCIDIFHWRNKSQDQQTVGIEAAVRITIVRAAAEIGRQMQEGGAA